MYSKINTCVLEGLKGYRIEVECDIANGLRAMNIVGLADTSIKESKERVRSAITKSGIKFPIKRITINLAPANLRKEGSQLDLPIAVSILVAHGIIYPVEEHTAFIGELSLDGRIVPVDGALPMILSLKEMGITRVIIPSGNRDECAMVKGIDLIVIQDLEELIEYINGKKEILPFESDDTFGQMANDYEVDFSDIKGQSLLKRAMEISAAGAHNLLMIGPPGSGKTMAAMRLPTILPSLRFQEAMECTKIYSVAGLLTNESIVTRRPFRAPHHTASSVSIIGGGRIPKPGEISLAHNGALFLDELPEFPKATIEVLRQPLETKSITISRANASLNYPANFLFVAGMNPCPCGYYRDPNHECTCSMHQVTNYLNKVSRPILDRIDIHIEVTPVKLEDLTQDKKEETSEQIRLRVETARKRQEERFQNESITTNGQMSGKQIKKYISLSPNAQRVLEKAFDTYRFSARTYDKILKLSLTIADLDAEDRISEKHIFEAIRYRTVDKKYWG